MMVLIKDNNLPPFQWKVGRIIQVFPGGDGNVRVAMVRTIDEENKRTVRLLCPLPIEGAGK